MTPPVRGTVVKNAPNLITVGRIVLAPVVVAAIASGSWGVALGGFILAGASDGIDGWIAKRYGLRSELGAYLDPLADKALLVSIFVALAWSHASPIWLAVLILFRDLMIVGAVIVSWLMSRPVAIQPLLISKANTAAQIAYAAAILAAETFVLPLGGWASAFAYVVAALTLGSLAAYLMLWLKHMSG